MVKNEYKKDLGIKIGTQDQVLWTKVAKEAEILIEQSEQNIIIQKAIFRMAEKKIAAEKEKFK